VLKGGTSTWCLRVGARIGEYDVTSSGVGFGKRGLVSPVGASGALLGPEGPAGRFA